MRNFGIRISDIGFAGLGVFHFLQWNFVRAGRCGQRKVPDEAVRRSRDRIRNRSAGGAECGAAKSAGSFVPRAESAERGRDCVPSGHQARFQVFGSQQQSGRSSLLAAQIRRRRAPGPASARDQSGEFDCAFESARCTLCAREQQERANGCIGAVKGQPDTDRPHGRGHRPGDDPHATKGSRYGVAGRETRRFVFRPQDVRRRHRRISECHCDRSIQRVHC